MCSSVSKVRGRTNGLPRVLLEQVHVALHEPQHVCDAVLGLGASLRCDQVGEVAHQLASHAEGEGGLYEP